MTPVSQEIRSAPGSILQADSILCRENDPSLVQVFRQEKSLAVRMMYNFSTLLEHLKLFKNFGDPWKTTTRQSTTSISTGGSVKRINVQIRNEQRGTKRRRLS